MSTLTGLDSFLFPQRQCLGLFCFTWPECSRGFCWYVCLVTLGHNALTWVVLDVLDVCSEHGCRLFLAD